MPPFQLAPQSERDDDNRSANTARMVNCYLEPLGQEMVIKSVLGMTGFATLPGVFTRAMVEIADKIYAMQGGTLYEVNAAGVVTALASDMPDTIETTISSNSGKITIVAGGRYFVWDGSALTEPTTGAFDAFGSVSYFGSLTVLTEAGGRRVQWSNVLDPDTLDGLSFATAAAYDDNILRGMAIGGSFWVFKEGSIERWYQNGADLAPVQGGALEYGLRAHNLLARIPNGAFFVTSENKVRVMGLGGSETVSTRGVETALANSTPTHCFFYEDEGHGFCVVRFSDRPAWCFDMATKRWHERSEGDTKNSWSAIASAKAFGKWNVADGVGPVYQMARTNEDAQGPLIREVTSTTMRNDGRRFKIPRFEAEGLVGLADLGREASVMLQMSKDQGETWTAPKVRSMGGLGNYGDRMVWRSLGQFRTATARLSISDPAELPISNTVFVDVA